MLAVVDRALTILSAILRVEDRLPGFDHRDVHTWPKLGQPFREHRRGDAAADDADVGFVNSHRLNGSGFRVVIAIGRHTSLLISAL